MRRAKVFMYHTLAGELIETEAATYRFTYSNQYLATENARSISLTLPIGDKVYESRTLFPFFDGLIPEGWLLDLSVRNWKLDRRDRMGLLLVACGDCIGAVHIEDASL